MPKQTVSVNIQRQLVIQASVDLCPWSQLDSHLFAPYLTVAGIMEVIANGESHESS